MRAGTLVWMAVLSVAWLGGCASVSVKGVDKKRSVEPRGKPSAVYVMPFSTEKAEFNVDREGAELDAFKKDVAAALASALADKLTKGVAPAQVLKAGARPPRKGWLVQGRFLRVNQGSRALRAFVGLGAGGTKLETEVEVLDLTRSRNTPFMSFQTTGGSGATPGMITSPGPVSAGIGMVQGATRGVTEDAERTARMITGMISQYMLGRKWIAPEQATPVKMEGEVGEVIPKPR
jgi:hypothetical protein